MATQAVVLLAAVILFGAAVPWLKGPGFLTPVFVLSYACIGSLFVAPAAASAFGSGREHIAGPGRKLILRGIAFIAGFGWGVSALLLFSGILTVNLRSWHGRFVTPDTRLLVAALLLGAAVCLSVTALSALLADAFGPDLARTALRFAFLGLFLLLALGSHFLPGVWQAAEAQLFATPAITAFAFKMAVVLTGLGTLFTGWLLALQRSP